MALATICVTPADSITRWTGRIGPSSNPSDDWYVPATLYWWHFRLSLFLYPGRSVSCRKLTRQVQVSNSFRYTVIANCRFIITIVMNFFNDLLHQLLFSRFNCPTVWYFLEEKKIGENIFLLFCIEANRKIFHPNPHCPHRNNICSWHTVNGIRRFSRLYGLEERCRLPCTLQYLERNPLNFLTPESWVL